MNDTILFRHCCQHKGTVSPPERCDLDGVKLEKVHDLFQVCRICIKGVTFYNMPQYVLLYHQNLCKYHRIFNLHKVAKIM